MEEHQRLEKRAGSPMAIWRSRARVVLIAFLAAAGLLLAYEHRIHLFTGDWLIIGLLALCVLMHAFMHGGHGGHGGHSGVHRRRDDDSSDGTT